MRISEERALGWAMIAVVVIWVVAVGVFLVIFAGCSVSGDYADPRTGERRAFEFAIGTCPPDSGSAP